MKAFVLSVIVISLSTVISSVVASPGPKPAPDAAPISAPIDQPYPGTIRLDVDASDTNRRILRVRESIPVAQQDIVLFYPKWVPGVHAPTGPIDRFAGLVIKANGSPLVWHRDPVDIYAFHVIAPAGVTSLDVEFQYLSPTSSAVGTVDISPDILTLRWNTVLLYPAGYFARQIAIDASITLPTNWKFGSALEVVSSTGATVSFKTTTLETLVDSPLFSGRYFAKFDLDPNGTAPVHLNVVADSAEFLVMSPEQLSAHQALIQQAYKLFGNRHYEHYDFLLALSENLDFAGLEHHRSSENVTWPKYLSDPKKTPYFRDLMPHEYTHSWNGKFRRPEDLWTANYNVPMRDTMLWVYEGLTEYWGQVLTARSGLWSKQQALEEIARMSAYFSLAPGRSWRSVQDTTSDEIINPRRPQSWNTWQRFEDYYYDGQLFWLEADVLIREISNGSRSLDDFAQSFYAGEGNSSIPVTYSFEDVIQALNRIQPYDWSEFFRDHLEAIGQPAPLNGLHHGGYKITYTDQSDPYLDAVESQRKFTDFIYSVGIRVDKDGIIKNVLWNSTAFDSKLTEGIQIIAVNGVAYDPDILKSAITSAKSSTAPIALIVKIGNLYRTVEINYHDGLRYPHLERNSGNPAILDDILATKN